MDLVNNWICGPVMGQAFQEQKECIQEVHRLAREVAESNGNGHPQYSVQVEPLAPETLSLKRNVFSTLFQSAYHLLEVSADRRILYGKLIHLFRMWVTSADNLLDDEDKVVLPIRMKGSSRVMSQVITLMTADRVLTRILNDACDRGLITGAQAQRLADGSLQVLLPSAAEEAAEEGGIEEPAPPDEVLNSIHSLKTGMLFNVAFLGPEVVESNLEPSRLQRVRAAYHQFGIGCQILDDIRDLAKDHCERRHNYILSILHWSRDPFLETLRNADVKPEDRLLFMKIPSVVTPTARQALGMIRDSMLTLSDLGLGFPASQVPRLAASMLPLLDLKELLHV